MRQVSFSSLKSQGCKNIRHNIRFMSFAITRLTSPPPPYDDWVSNALNLNIFAITDDKHVRSTKYKSMVILDFRQANLKGMTSIWMNSPQVLDPASDLEYQQFENKCSSVRLIRYHLVIVSKCGSYGWNYATFRFHANFEGSSLPRISITLRPVYEQARQGEIDGKKGQKKWWRNNDFLWIPKVVLHSKASV